MTTSLTKFPTPLPLYSSKQLLNILNSQIAQLARSYRSEEALHLFTTIHSSPTSSLHHHPIKPDHYTLSSTLTACTHLHNILFGDQLHGYAIRAGLKQYSHVSNTLLALYREEGDLCSLRKVFEEISNPDVYSWTTFLSGCIKLGEIGYACKVFDSTPRRDVAVWNAMITGCMENGYENIGIEFFRRMHVMGVRHDNYSFASVLSVCSLGLVDFGMQVHSLVVKTGFLVRSSVVNALITMYFNCERFTDARVVFKETSTLVHDQVTFNVMIDGLVSLGRVKEAFLMFREMLEAKLKPTELTFVSLMGSCSCVSVGRQVHGQAIKIGLEGCTSVCNAAIYMYSSCGDIETAYFIFENLKVKDLISWNTMISSFAQVSLGRSGIKVYQEMQRVGIRPDQFTFGSLLVTADFTKTVEMIHTLVCKYGFMSKIEVSNALISAYSKHGKIGPAYNLFSVSTKNLISWNTTISGAMLNGFPIQALENFSNLLVSDLKPNPYTLTIVLTICVNISSLKLGKQVHSYILKHDHFQDISVGNALITLYTKCGVLDWALKVFHEMVEKDTVSWNALISAFAQHGEGKEAVKSFHEMQDVSKIKPDKTTFTAVLSACSHAGLVDEGATIFNSMVKDYGFVPEEEHLSCIVDLLARAGYLDEASNMINNNIRDIEAHANVWWALFSACAAYGDMKHGSVIAGFLLEREKDNPTVYVVMSNIYAAAGRWEEAASIRALMKNVCVKKQRGCSWIRT